jgi:hypothetical protein
MEFLSIFYQLQMYLVSNDKLYCYYGDLWGVWNKAASFLLDEVRMT